MGVEGLVVVSPVAFCGWQWNRHRLCGAGWLGSWNRRRFCGCEWACFGRFEPCTGVVGFKCECWPLCIGVVGFMQVCVGPCGGVTGCVLRLAVKPASPLRAG